MKTSIRRFFNRIVALLLTVLIMTNIPFTTLAMMSTDDFKNLKEEVIHQQESAVLSDEGGYRYTAPSEGEFLIENATGVVSIANETPVVEFNGQVVLLPAFDYYKVVDQSGNVRFYQADVLKDATQINSIVYIGLYVENGSIYSFHFQYKNDLENKLYNIMIPLTEEQFIYFTANAVELCLGTDEVSQRLKFSGRVYTQGAFQNSNINNEDSLTYSTSVSPNARNYIPENSYDSYTNTDGIIHAYDSDYYGEYYLEDEWTITDDPIVNIIPKELCFILGEHIYVGKEYGFFIRVIVDTIDLDDYAVDILVFDIIHTTPSFMTTETGSSKVVPLFQYTYRAADADSFSSPVDPTLSRIVIPHVHYDYADYYLKDVGFRISLDNANALNPGDSGYVASEDDGAFMVQTRVNARGVGLKKKDNDFAEDTALFALGFIPVIGDIVSTFAYVHDQFNGFGSEYVLYETSGKVCDRELSINTYKTNSSDQIAEYGNLLKSQAVKLVSDTNEPRLIHVGGYVEAKYVIARKSGSTNNKFRVTTSVSVNIVEDKTSLFLGTPTGELVDYGRATGTYETGSYKRLEDIALNGGASVAVGASSKINIIKVVPKVSGIYKIFTTSNMGDPDFRITNATAGTSEITATDDIDGANDRNAALTLNLIAGNVYYIEAFRYSTPYDYALRIGYNPTSTQQMTGGIPIFVTTTDDSYQMLEFSPTVTGYYELSTTSTSGDPQVFVFDSTGMLIASDDDSGYNLNAFLDCYLYLGDTYYIAVQGYNGSAAAFYVSISFL